MNKILDKDGNMLPGPPTLGQADDREIEINAVNEEELFYSEDELYWFLSALVGIGASLW